MEAQANIKFSHEFFHGSFENQLFTNFHRCTVLNLQTICGGADNDEHTQMTVTSPSNEFEHSLFE